MIRVISMAVLIITNFILQATLLPHFSILQVTPDTALIFIVSYAVIRGEIEGSIFGFFAGLVYDVLGGLVIGHFALLGFLTGYVCGKPFRDFFKDNYFLPFFVVIGVSFVYQFTVYISSIIFFGQPDFWFYFRSIILPKTIYTASLSIPLYGFLYFINAKIVRWQRNDEDERNIQSKNRSARGTRK
ncbi:MAG: rod shape-determining protein MreD [Clostridiales bacterium]|jgi:rod shape-determining protein MreD|nr:rod shape-determining protein MreD [Clostridiales bacterium]